MLSPLKEFFHYSRGERKGALGLLIIVSLLIVWYFIRGLFITSSSEDFTEFKEQITQFNAENSADISFSAASIDYFSFDPNIIGTEEWIALGFSEKQANSIENYKASGAVFKIKKDLLKLFMVDDAKYAELEPYIDLPESINYTKDFNTNKENWNNNKIQYVVVLKKSPTPLYTGFEDMDSIYYTKKDQVYWYCKLPFESAESAKVFKNSHQYGNAQIIEESSLRGYYPIKQRTKQLESFTSNILVSVNIADTAEFTLISGIGLGYAKRIIKYREALGGFISIDQMKEVYKLPPEIIDNNIDYFKLDTSHITKININIVEVNTLRLHPYISWNVANSIVQMRNNHGDYKNVSDIKKSDLINEELFLKIAPYLSVK